MDVLRHFLSLSFITTFQLLPYSYYNSYNASALINAPNRFSKIMFFFFVVFFFSIASLDDVALCHEVSS